MTEAHQTAEAQEALRRIEHRARHVFQKLRVAAQILLGLPLNALESEAEGAEAGPFSAILTTTVAHWQPLIPKQPTTDATVVAALETRYQINLKQGPDGEWTAAHSDQNDDLHQPPASEQQTGTQSAALMSMIQALEWRYTRRGERLFRAGDKAHGLYVIVDGTVQIVSPPPMHAGDGTTPVVTRQGTGTLLGQRALLTSEPHAVTAHALRDSDLCFLRQAQFDRLIQQHPALLRQVAVQMAAYTATYHHHTQLPGWSSRCYTEPQYAGQRAGVVTILPACDDVAAFTQPLVRELATHGTVLDVTPEQMATSIPTHNGPSPTLETYVDEYQFVDWLQEQRRRYNFIVYVADANFPNWTRRCVEQADTLLIVGRAGASPALSRVEEIVNAMPHPTLIPQRELVLLHHSRHHSRHHSPGDTAHWLALRNGGETDVRRHHHVALDTGDGIARVSRFLRGRAIGLVCGGGGIRAAAACGVIQVLEELDICADVVGGTSSGAIIAAAYALGWDAMTIIRTLREQLLQRHNLIDPTLPLTAAMRGYRLAKTYRAIFGEAKMEDLWTTPFTVSANLTQAKMVVHSTGALHHGVRASTSLAGIFPPALNEQGDLLIDGGIFDNTPADVARAMVDSGPVIAVDLGFTQREGTYEYGEYLNGFRVLASRLNPFAETIEAPSLIGIMMRANALASINATDRQVAHADLVVRPPVGDYGLFDLDAFETIVQAGYDEARSVIPEWLHTLEENS